MATFSKRVIASGEVTYQAKCRRSDFPTLTKTFRSLADAKKWARGIERSWDTGEGQATQPQADTTLGDLLKRYREEVTPTLRSGDLDAHRITLWLKEPFTKVRVADLTPSVFATYRDERLKKVSAGTVLRELNIIRAALNRAKIEWGVAVPECRITRPRAPAPRDRRLKPGELEKLLEGCKQSRIIHLAPAIILAVETAARQGELLALTWKNVDLEQRTARFPVTKNGHPRTIPLSSRAVAVLSGLERKGDRVLWAFGKDRCSLKHAFVRLRERVKIDGLRFHDLRREGVSRMLERGLNIVEVSQVSGHRTLSMIQRYAAPRAEDIAKKLG
ncbi:site-specific recombinase XerD [Paraburkholderia sp. RAU2J]|uniref:site-specific integrase n=1 Tax=Paraburkholderia sp. RAU2J TaxID=1938810 RepID=UPI000EB3BC1B|nr:site-specific integrase [Paraburkholderia sp. RAU2J]RKT25489.1 site-specific recombinase XerD [Paraburkholderia sp. RAU2J]